MTGRARGALARLAGRLGLALLVGGPGAMVRPPVAAAEVTLKPRVRLSNGVEVSVSLPPGGRPRAEIRRRPAAGPARATGRPATASGGSARTVRRRAASPGSRGSSGRATAPPAPAARDDTGRGTAARSSGAGTSRTTRNRSTHDGSGRTASRAGGRPTARRAVARPGKSSRTAPAHQRTSASSRPVAVRRPPASLPAPVPEARGLGSDADLACVQALRQRGVPFVTAGQVRGIQTPVEVTGPIAGLRLVPRARRPPLMDCRLAHLLADAAPRMRQLGVAALSYSGTYDYRNVRGTSKLSGHARGLAIDVHGLETTLGNLDVERDYPKDPGRWPGSYRRPPSVGECVGAPARAEGRLLRTLACELRASDALALVITPDDNYDHRNHLHLEAHPGGSQPLLSGQPGGAHQGRRIWQRR